MLNTIIVEDVPLQLNKLERLLNHYCYDTIKIVAKCITVEEAILAIEENQPDLVFLDVILGDKSGLDILKKVDIIDFDIIFTTGEKIYAYDAWKVSATDFLLKPIVHDELIAAVYKVLSRINKRDKTIKLVNIADAREYIFYSIDSIYYIESSGSYTTFWGHLEDEASVRELAVASHNLKYFAKKLERANFYRIHDSYMINLNKLLSFTDTGSTGEVQLKKNNGILKRIPVSERKKADFKQRIKDGIY